MLNLKYLPLVALTLILPLQAQKKKKKTPKKTQSERVDPLSPEEQLKTFTLPDGFTIELVASEKNGLINPIDIAFDDAGRMWTQTAEMYPLDPNRNILKRKSQDGAEKGSTKPQSELQRIRALYQLKTRGTDKILIINDPTRQVEGQIHVFSEGMALPQSILPYKNGVYVAHGSEMLFMEDTDGDLKSDRHETVLTGFGINDTHTMSHTLVRGPGKWIHFSHGALNKGDVTAVKSGHSVNISYSKLAKFSLDGNHLEITNNGHNNIWGFHLKSNGQWYGTEANDRFFSLVPFHPLMGYSGIGNSRLKKYQPFPANFHKFTVNGTGISGLAYDENGKEGWPEKWKNIGFLANPITNTINCVIADRAPDGSVISEHLPDFLSCSDDWFRPVNIEFGPDGCLYIVDWYNKIVSHNEVKRDHPDRDKSHGRIWRVRHKDQKVSSPPNLMQASEQDLLTHLRAEILWEKRAAWHQIVDREATSLIPSLKTLVAEKGESLETRIHALWSLEGLGAYDKALLEGLLKEKNPDLKREALRTLETFNPSVEDLAFLVGPFLNDPHYMVKEQALRTLGTVKKASPATIEMLVRACKPVIATEKGTGSDNTYGGTYEHNFQRFLALYALENYPKELQAFLSSPAAEDLPSENLTEAAKSLPKDSQAKKVLAAVIKGTAPLSGENLASIAPSLKDPKVLKSLQGKIEKKEFIQLALDNQEKLKPSDLEKALLPGVKKLLSSPKAEDQNLALDAVTAFQLKGASPQVIALLKEKALNDITVKDIQALGVSSKQDRTLLHHISKNKESSMNIRAKALLAYARGDLANATIHFTTLYKEAPAEEKEALINSAASNAYGLKFILHLITEKSYALKDLDENTLDRLLACEPETKHKKAILSLLQQKRVKMNKEGREKINHYLTAAKTLKGNPATGEALFNSCLACHQVGNKGYDIAPSLGGSSNRDLHHLLTAIILPDEAVEGGYRLYQVIKSDGDILEGYMYGKTSLGTTVSFMGGAQKFTSAEHIKKERFVNNKSFMVSSFRNLPDQSMVDLISYIKTIK